MYANQDEGSEVDKALAVPHEQRTDNDWLVLRHACMGAARYMIGRKFASNQKLGSVMMADMDDIVQRMLSKMNRKSGYNPAKANPSYSPRCWGYLCSIANVVSLDRYAYITAHCRDARISLVIEPSLDAAAADPATDEEMADLIEETLERKRRAGKLRKGAESRALAAIAELRAIDQDVKGDGND